jgi:uncharacterized protein YqfA (UPF0365 family)
MPTAPAPQSVWPLLLAADGFFDTKNGVAPGWIVVGAISVIFVIVVLVVAINYGKLWFQAYMSNARVTIWNLIGMSLRKVDARVIVQA